MDGEECALDDACRAGALDCINGACVDVGPAVDGTRCGSNGRCLDGACETCGSACALANPCKQATWTCTSGTPVCTATGSDLPNGAACGADRVCAAGACVGATWELEVVSGGAQSAVVTAQLAPVVVRLRDTGGTALANVPVTISATDGAGAPTSVTTNAQGTLSVTPRLGRAPGVYTFTFAAEAASPLEVTATATAPAVGTLFTVVNVDHTSGNSGVPGAGTLARVGVTRGLASASDGTLFVSAGHRVYALLPEGVLFVVAGTGTSGSTGDNGPAENALLSTPSGLAFDEENLLLFIADTGNQRIRVVDLQSGIISTYAGGGNAAGPGYGDGDLATNAVFALDSGALSIGPDGALYVADDGHLRFRRIDPGSGIITAWLSRPATSPSCTGAPVLVDCPSGGCSLAWSPSGEAIVFGGFCGTNISASSGNGINAIVRRSEAGALTHIAGTAHSSVSTDGVPATSADLVHGGAVAVDAGGNVFVSLTGQHKVRRIEAATGFITTVAGDGTWGFFGDYVPASSGILSSPRGILTLPGGGVVFADGNNAAVRRIWGASE